MGKLNEVITFGYLSAVRAMKSAGNKVKERIDRIRNDESGMEIIAVVLILVVVLTLVVVFRKNIMKFASDIWEQVFDQGNQAKDSSDDITPGWKG